VRRKLSDMGPGIPRSLDRSFASRPWTARLSFQLSATPEPFSRTERREEMVELSSAFSPSARQDCVYSPSPRGAVTGRTGLLGSCSGRARLRRSTDFSASLSFRPPAGHEMFHSGVWGLGVLVADECQTLTPHSFSSPPSYRFSPFSSCPARPAI